MVASQSSLTGSNGAGIAEMAEQQEREPEPHPALWLAPTVLLVLALGPWPYGYFQFLRLIVCGACTFLAYREFKRVGVAPWTVALGSLALVFNPIAPVHLARSVWSVLDLGAAAVLMLHFWANRKARSPSS